MHLMWLVASGALAVLLLLFAVGAIGRTHRRRDLLIAIAVGVTGSLLALALLTAGGVIS